jgi:hypothetical protein
MELRLERELENLVADAVRRGGFESPEAETLAELFRETEADALRILREKMPRQPQGGTRLTYGNGLC